MVTRVRLWRIDTVINEENMKNSLKAMIDAIKIEIDGIDTRISSELSELAETKAEQASTDKGKRVSKLWALKDQRKQYAKFMLQCDSLYSDIIERQIPNRY